MTFVLYNPLASNKNGKNRAMELESILEGEKLEFADITALEDFDGYFRSLSPDDKVIIAGGDGTLNRFVNGVNCENITCELLYYAAGSGNDFMHDVQDRAENGIVRINEYIQGLPTVTVNGKLISL